MKLEGGRKRLDAVHAILDAEIPVMGHLGLTPQSVNAFGGFKVQGKTLDAARVIVDDAVALAEAGCFAVVLECVPDAVARLVTDAIPVPTIGIGAGRHCDGQVLVYHDILGLRGPRCARSSSAATRTCTPTRPTQSRASPTTCARAGSRRATRRTTRPRTSARRWASTAPARRPRDRSCVTGAV